MNDIDERVNDWTDVELLRRQLVDSEKATLALQQMVDALSLLPALENFVPAALPIVARALNIRDCAYYEHRRGDPIRLRYWFLDGKVFGPREIRAFGDDREYAGVKAMEAGFYVPDTYLGVPFRKRTKASVLNHGGEQPDDARDDLARLLGWYMVLNVPLVIAGEADGALVIHRGFGSTYTSSEIKLAERLAQQLALAMEIDRLAANARNATSAQEREVIAHAQLDEMAKTDRALQQTTDALAAMPDLDNFIPAALRIIAEAFDAKDSAYYEHRSGDPIRLRYWYFNGRVLGPQDIANLDSEDFAFMRHLAEGFTVPDSYIGVPFRQRTRASIVDHTKPDPPSDSDLFCIERGWEIELNVPLVVSGEADGALIICRKAGSWYTPREIALAERLGQQLALAMEASRLSAAAKQEAVARERERAARERTAELSRYAEALKQTVDSLAAEEDFLGFIGRLLVIASVQLNTPIVEYWSDDGLTRATLVLTCRDGVVYGGSDDPRDVRARGVDISPRAVGVERYRDRTMHRIIDMIRDTEFREYAESFGMPVRQWCSERGVQQLVLIPLLRSGFSYGAFCFYLPEDRALEPSQLDLAFSLGQQVSLAVRMTELAEQSKQNALSREREAAANERAAELSRANEVLRAALEQLSDERDLHTFPRAILGKAMEQFGARDGVIFVFDPNAKTLTPVEYMGNVNSPQASTVEFSRPFPADPAPLWTSVVEQRAPIVFDVELEGHMLLPGEAEWHRNRGNRSVVVSPMFVNSKPYGYFGMALAERADDFSKVDLGLIQALTQQASLAIQLTRLADESKHTALAQEREKAAEERTAEITNANKVLRATLDQLSKDQDLQSFPRTILAEAMKHAGARDGLILKFDPQADVLTRSEYLASKDLPPASTLEFSRPFAASATPAWVALVAKRSPIVFDVELDAPMLLPGLGEWHRKRGNRSIIAVAMFIDSKPYGYFGITLAERAADVSNVKVGLIHALTQQATLAIQLTQLAEESQQSAVMVERQHAVVQERANMAREIHDKLAQGYAAILIQQHAMRRLLQKTDGAQGGLLSLVDNLDIIEQLSKSNLADARKTMDELRVDPFGPGDLSHSLQQCIGQLPRDRDFEVELTIVEDLPAVRRYAETEVCRIVLEAVTNARRHARTDVARVIASKQQEHLCILIQDDGIGFDTQTIGPSFGISSMHERAARAGAELKIVSAPGCGTEVRITLLGER